MLPGTYSHWGLQTAVTGDFLVLFDLTPDAVSPVRRCIWVMIVINAKSTTFLHVTKTLPLILLLNIFPLDKVAMKIKFSLSFFFEV